MMDKEFIKMQMKNIGVSTNKLKDITGIGYATLSDYFNKRDYNISYKNYNRVIDTLFTPFERLLYSNAVSKAIGSKYDYEYWFDELKRRKIIESIKSDRISIERSGAPYSDDSVIRMLPAHIIITFNDVEGKNTTRIFDKVLYNKLNNSGKKKKIELIKSYFE